MQIHPSIMERAFQIARGGDCHTMLQLRRMLAQEGFSHVDSHLDGPSLRKQLKTLMAVAR